MNSFKCNYVTSKVLDIIIKRQKKSASEMPQWAEHLSYRNKEQNS